MGMLLLLLFTLMLFFASLSAEITFSSTANDPSSAKTRSKLIDSDEAEECVGIIVADVDNDDDIVVVVAVFVAVVAGGVAIDEAANVKATTFPGPTAHRVKKFVKD